MNSSSLMSFRDMLLIWFKYKNLSIVSILLIAVAGTVLTLRAPRLYEAQTRVYIRPDNESLVLTNQASPYLKMTLEETVFTEVEILKSNVLLEQALDKLVDKYGDRKPEAARIKERMLVEPLRKTSVIELRYRDPDPRFAQDLLNALAQTYAARASGSLAKNQEIEHYNTEYLSITERIRAVGDSLTDLRKQNQVLSLAEQKQWVVTYLGDIKSSKMEIERNVQAHRSQLSYLDGKIKNFDPLDYPFVQAERQRQVSEMQKQYMNLLAQYETQSKIYRTENPVLQQVQASIQQLKAKMLDVLRSERDLSANKLEQFRAELAVVEQQEAETSQRMQELLTMESRYNNLQISESELNALASTISKKLEEARLASGSNQQARVEQIRTASLPKLPTTPNVPFDILATVVFSLVIGLGLPFAFNMLSNVLETPYDVMHRLELPLLGIIRETKP